MVDFLTFAMLSCGRSCCLLVFNCCTHISRLAFVQRTTPRLKTDKLTASSDAAMEEALERSMTTDDDSGDFSAQQSQESAMDVVKSAIAIFGQAFFYRGIVLLMTLSFLLYPLFFLGAVQLD